MRLTNLNQLIEENQRLKGYWELSPNHEIRYKANDLDEEIRFRGSLVSAQPGALVVSFSQIQTNQEVTRRLAALTGTWRLDPENRLLFEVERGRGQRDTLTFKGSWKTGKLNELIYQFDEAHLKRKSTRKHRLIFQGRWDITDRHGLAYFLSKDSDSAFRFRGAFQTKSILAKKGEIKYQLGAEISSKRPYGKERVETLTLFGKWKVSRNLSLGFEMGYEDGRKRTMVFGGEYDFDKNRQIAVNLKSREGKPLGVELVLTKKFRQDNGEAFARLARSIEESKIEAGLKFKW